MKLSLNYPVAADQLLKIETISALKDNSSAKDVSPLLNNSDPFQTNNWDTVFAANYADLNAYIIKRMKDNPNEYPTAWQANVPGSIINPPYSGKGNFGPWQLAIGVSTSGNEISMVLPLTSCTVTINGADYEIYGAVANASVTLNMIPDKDNSNTNSLKVNTVSDGTNKILTVNSVSYTSPASPDFESAIAALLESWASNNLAQFQHIFAIVNLNETAAQKGFQWLKPTATTYSFISGSDLESSVLGVLCMVNNNPEPTGAAILDTGAIPPGSRAGFNISQNMFLTQMVLPSLPGAFDNAQASSFTILNDKITLAPDVSVKLDDVKYLGVNYTPYLTDFSFSIDNEVIEIYSYVHVNISPGIDSYIETTAQYTLLLGTNSSGVQSLTYLPVGKPVQHTSTTVAEWVVWTEAIADIVLAIGTAIIGNAASAIENAVVRAIVAVIVGGVVSAIAAVLEKIPEWIAGKVPDDLPSIDGLVTDATNSFQWGDSADYKLTSAQLNGSLQLGGILNSL